MPLNTFYKPHSTPKEREALFQWFEQHMGQLPKQLEIPSMKIYDVPYYVRRSILSLRGHLEKSPIFEGNFALLRYVKQVICQQQGLEE